MLRFARGSMRVRLALDDEGRVTGLTVRPGDWRRCGALSCGSTRAVSLAANTRHARLASMSLHLFAGIRVRDLGAARGWYDRLLGEPTFFPHATEAVWTLADDRSIYVVEHAVGAGHSTVTIFLDDLDAQIEAIAARGLEPDEIAKYANGARKALYRDVEGNEVGFGGATDS